RETAVPRQVGLQGRQCKMFFAHMDEKRLPMSSHTVENAHHPGVIDVVKHIADQPRSELGFHARQAYVYSLNKGELLIAKMDGHIVGFVRYHHRRDGCTTLY